MLPYQQEMVVLQGQAIGKYCHYYINHSLNLSSLVSSPFFPPFPIFPSFLLLLLLLSSSTSSSTSSSSPLPPPPPPLLFLLLLLFLLPISDTLGILARTIGSSNFQPIAEESVQLGMVNYY